MARKLRTGDRFICEIEYTGKVDDDNDGVFNFHIPGLKGGQNPPYDYWEDTVYVSKRAFGKLTPIEEYNGEARKRFADPASVEAFLEQVDG